ncbi:MAG: SDR family NAD(P)-dependent oxidoreductase [Bacteroidetes bacterium]|nr:SDR family NAD(P)-dependent oxidoreductase [Bacteroidota bacterium]
MNILVTGTSTGLGKGLAKYYLKQGHTVYGISRNSDKELNSNENFKFLAQDLSNFKEAEKNVVKFLNELLTLDIVILNAGKLNEIKDLKDTSLEEIKELMDINVWANKILIDTIMKTVKQVIQVVAISSGASLHGSRGWNAYSLSKATLNMLIDLYSKELPDTHFIALAPGLIDTNMQDYIYNYPDEEKYPVVKKLREAKGTPNMPKPDDAAKLVADAVKNSFKYASGSFLDVRSL